MDVPFRYVHHLLTVPVLLDRRRESRFVLDTGIGVNLLSTAAAAALGCEPTGETYTGRRMSGQEVTLALARLAELRFGEVEAADVEVALFDMSAFPHPDFDGVEGFLSLTFFVGRPFTVDYPAGVVRRESAASLRAVRARGTAMPLRVEDDGHAVCAFTLLAIPGGTTVEVEIDTGSDALILDERLAPTVGVSLDAPGVRRVEGEDETGNAYTRYFTRLEGAVHPPGAPDVAQTDPDVMFQRIVYEGLVGDAFLRRFAVTYDLEGGELILSP